MTPGLAQASARLGASSRAGANVVVVGLGDPSRTGYHGATPCRPRVPLKGYVTNLSTTTMDGAAVIAAYHDLWRVEQSFRMT